MPAKARQDWPTTLGGHSQPAEDDTLVFFVRDTEAALEPAHLAVLPQDLEAEGMEGTASDVFSD